MSSASFPTKERNCKMVVITDRYNGCSAVRGGVKGRIRIEKHKDFTYPTVFFCSDSSSYVGTSCGNKLGYKYSYATGCVGSDIRFFDAIQINKVFIGELK